MKIRAVVCTVILVILAAGCTKKTEEFTLSETHKIIFDTDTAADDAMALIMVAKAPNIELKGVTVLSGNVSMEQGCKNALMSLEVAGRGDVQVYPGSVTKFSGVAIEPYSVFGADGMGDQGLIHPVGKPEETDGIDFILETVRKAPGEIEILATGPLTNVAKAIEKDPETMKNVKRIWSMGSGGLQYMGNANPVAEFNVYTDIEAYEYVLQSGIPMTIVGNDVCALDGVKLSEEERETLEKAGDCGKFIAGSLTVMLKTCASADGYTQVCDPVAAAALIWEDFAEETVLCDADAVTEEGPAKGEVVFYRNDAYYDMIEKEINYHIDVVSGLDGDGYLENVCRLIR